MILIGLTGCIATGKSSCSKRFAATEGVTVIDCDQLVHELQRPGSEATRQIKKAFPSAVSDDLVLNRPVLAQIVFNDHQKRKKLGDIMNKLIFIEIVKTLIKLWATKPRNHIVILDAPTLYESKMFVHVVSSVIVVSASEEKQLARLIARNGYTREDALSRMRSQISNDQKKLWADFVIDNDEDGEDKLDRKVADAVSWIRQTQGASKVPLLLAGTVATVAMAAAVAVLLPMAALKSLKR